MGLLNKCTKCGKPAVNLKDGKCVDCYRISQIVNNRNVIRVKACVK